MFRQSKAQ
jgi:hypothetical protein